MNEICKIMVLTNIWRLGKNNFNRLMPRRTDDAEMLSDGVPAGIDSNCGWWEVHDGQAWKRLRWRMIQ